MHGIVADHGGRSAATTGVGDFVLDFGSYSPPTTQVSHDETLDFAFAPYLDTSSLLTFDEIHSMIGQWEADDDPNDFLFWTNGWGGAHRAFLHAMRLLDVYRSFIPNNNGNCPDARARFKDRWKAKAYDIQVDNLSKCSETPDQITYETGTAFPKSIDHVGSRGFYNSLTGAVHPCANMVTGQGHLADAFMAYAHRAYWYVAEGESRDFWEACSYLWQAQMLGRLALGAIAHVSRGTLHEMMHQEFGNDHCELGCCHQRIALRWQCRTFSFLGLYAADPYSGIDRNLSTSTVYYATTCRDADILTGTAKANFVGACSFTTPGIQGSEQAWTGASKWTNPGGCP